MRQGEAIISQGHRRIAAVDLLIEQGKWDEGTMLIPTLLEPAGTGDLELFVNQFTTNDSEPLKPREAAYNIMRIKSLLGGNLDETAKRIGRSRSYVDQLLRFNEEATPEVHEAIAKGEISQTQAATILRKEGAKKGAATIREAVATAKASGKKKATKRDVEAAKPTASPLLNDLYVRVEHITPVQTAAIVLARDFLERVEFEFADPATCKEAGRIVAELNHALGEPAQMAAE
jgi:ParB-like chromosome segregation protein Spo0J